MRTHKRGSGDMETRTEKAEPISFYSLIGLFKNACESITSVDELVEQISVSTLEKPKLASNL